MSTTRTWTETDLMALPRDGWKRELVDGEIVASPAGAPHGRVVIELSYRLRTFLEAHPFGILFDSSTGCWMPSRNLRSPDITYVSHERLPHGVPAGFLDVVPDLVVEVLSPGDSPRLILDKVREYLAAGVRLVWVIDPKERTARCWRTLATSVLVRDDQPLEGEPVLPGFRCRLADVLA